MKILGLARAQLTPSPCLISIIRETVTIGVVKKKKKNLQRLVFGVLFQTTILSEVTRIQAQDTLLRPVGELFSSPNQVKNHWVPSGGAHLTPSHLPLCPHYATLTHK